jgi:hypothetical protein
MKPLKAAILVSDPRQKIAELERNIAMLQAAPHLHTPEGAIYFVTIVDPPANPQIPPPYMDPATGCELKVVLGKRAAKLFQWAQQFKNHSQN